jgi:hypothetical protein
VDLIFAGPGQEAIYLVELKRGGLTAEHEAQLQRYFGVARQSPLLADYLDREVPLRGILATVSDRAYVSSSPDIEAVVVEKAAVIDVLSELRQARLGD